MLVFTSCGDDDEPPQDQLPDPKAPEIPFRISQSADATFQATYYSTRVDSGIIGRITFFQGIGFAAFLTENGSLTSPKKIKLEGTELGVSKGIYTNAPGKSQQGIDFGSSVLWEVEGRGNIPDFDEEIMSPVPEIGNINIRDSVNSNKPLKLVIDTESPYTSLGQPDSVNYLLVGKRKSLARKTASLDTVSFTPEEVYSLGLGNAYIQAEAFRYQTRDYSGYEVRFINKGVFNKKVWIH